MANLKINTLTWNMANKSANSEIVATLLSPGGLLENQPDLIIISLQESGISSSFHHIILSFIGSQNYKLIHESSMKTLTKPTEIGSVQLIIFAIASLSVDEISRHTCRATNNPNKGGLSTRLAIDGNIFDIFACHLDAKSLDARQAQLTSLLKSTTSSAYASYQTSDRHLIILGDFNERFVMPVKSSFAQEINLKCNLQKQHEVDNLILAHDPLCRNDGHYFHEHGIVFHKLKDITYRQQLKEEKRVVTHHDGSYYARIKPGRDRPDVGCLDNVGIKSNKIAILSHTVFDPKNSDGNSFSDHKAVVKHFQYVDNWSEFEATARNRTLEKRGARQAVCLDDDFDLSKMTLQSGIQRRQAVRGRNPIAPSIENKTVQLVRLANTLSYCFETAEEFQNNLIHNTPILVPYGYKMKRVRQPSLAASNDIASQCKYQIINDYERELYTRNFIFRGDILTTALEILS